MVLMLGTCVLFHSHLVAIFEAQALDRFAHRLLPISSLQSNPNRTEIHSWPSHAFWSNDWDTYWEYYMGKSEPERNHPIVLYFTNKSENIFGNTKFEEKTSTWLNVLAALHKEFSRGPETHQLAMNVPVIIVSESKPRIHHSVRSVPSLLWLEPRHSSLFNRLASPSTQNTLYLTEDVTLDSKVLHQRIQDFFTSNWQLHIREPIENPDSQSDDSISIFDVLSAVSMIGFILRALYDYRTSIIQLIGRRSSWFVGSVLVLQFALCGVVHSVLHRSPLFFFHPQFGLFLIHPSARKQFWFEGLFFGSSSLLVSIAALSISYAMPLVKDETRTHELLRLAIFTIGTVYALTYATFALKYRWLS